MGRRRRAEHRAREAKRKRHALGRADPQEVHPVGAHGFAPVAPPRPTREKYQMSAASPVYLEIIDFIASGTTPEA